MLYLEERGGGRCGIVWSWVGVVVHLVSLVREGGAATAWRGKEVSWLG